MRPLQMERLLSARAQLWRLAERLGLDESLKRRGAHDASRLTRYNIARFRLLDVPNPAPTSGLQLPGSIVWIANKFSVLGHRASTSHGSVADPKGIRAPKERHFAYIFLKFRDTL